MARIAYVDHSFHMQTISTKFLSSLLRKHGNVVDNFWDESWRGGPPISWEAVCHYDAVIMFQVYCPISQDYYRTRHNNVTYVPMLDQWGFWRGPITHLGRFWEPFQGSKVLSFSTATHALATGFGIRSFFARYYQSPQASPVAPNEGLHGFFWLRREDQVSWNTIASLIGQTQFDSMHVHMASDPGSPSPRGPSSEQRNRHKITTSSWFENKADFTRIQEKANIFFAPRLGEGIGQSFLEAFSRGQCVVAANQGTMNEYILHEANGLLYDETKPTPLDFSRVVEIGRAGWNIAREGRARWEAVQEELVRFILTPSDEVYKGHYDHFACLAGGGYATPCATLRERIRELPLVRKTRPLWHPLWRRIKWF